MWSVKWLVHFSNAATRGGAHSTELRRTRRPALISSFIFGVMCESEASHDIRSNPAKPLPRFEVLEDCRIE